MRARDEIYDVAVLGTGPAGAAAALGASRLGYRTVVVSRPRKPAVEGLSARTIARLRESGLAEAADCASEPVPRWVHWAGDHSVRGHESIVHRQQFDAALHRVLGGNRVGSIDATVRRIQLDDDLWKIETSRGSFKSRTVLDARGRRARRCEKRGPMLLAWSAVRRCDVATFPASAVVAMNDGWCWIARSGGQLSLQFVGAARELRSGSLASRLNAVRSAVPELELEGPHPADSWIWVARAAVARYSRPAEGVGLLRIGDAAVAMDPLSGNGVHEALGSARVAVAAVNSYLLGADWRIPAQFVDDRAAELWRRSVAAAAGFYRRQAEHAPSDFWVGAARGYREASLEAVHREEGPGRFEMRPVLADERIELRPVWVSADWPRGVWKVNGRVLSEAPAELIPILRRARGASHHEGPR